LSRAPGQQWGGAAWGGVFSLILMCRVRSGTFLDTTPLFSNPKTTAIWFLAGTGITMLYMSIKNAKNLDSVGGHRAVAQNEHAHAVLKAVDF